MRKQIIAVSVFSLLSVPAFAEIHPVPEQWQVTSRVELNDGTFLNIYRDGKMAMENRFGIPVYMQPGHAMQTKDGRTVTMVGNETFRVEARDPLLTPRTDG
jgi:hypothetical protein